MNRTLIITILLASSLSTFGQADNPNSKQNTNKSNTVLEEISNKYGKSSSVTELLVSKVAEYESVNKVKILSKEEFAENIKLIKDLRQDLAKEKDNQKKASIEAKIDYLMTRRVEYSSIEVELLK